MDKGEMRGRYRDIRDRADRTGLDGAVFARLAGLDVFAEAGTVYSYVSFGSEVDTVRVIKHAFALGKKVAVPRITAKRQMEFVEIGGLDVLTPNKYGILEPACGAVLTPHAGDVILVPGLVFSEEMHRIGYGGGFYDVFLANAQNAVKIGLCYEFQIAQFSGGAHDVPMDYIVTDKRVITLQECSIFP